MANTVKLKRSSTPGAVPTTGQLALGELAMNTYDGKVYMVQNNGTASVVQVGGGSGTVTSVSVVSANGLAGTVATNTTTPAITLSTSVTGVVKGNGTALSAATAGTDYVAPGGALGTPSSGTLTNCTFPTLNQNTTGTASNVTGVVAVSNGGTGLSSTPANGALNIGNGTGFTRATITAGLNMAVTNGAGSISLATNIPTPQVTVYTSGSGTYTVPANTRYLQVKMVGGGGGGGGAGTSGGTGGTGGTTTFGSSSCTGGTGGSDNYPPGTGGIATISGGTGIAIKGGDGGACPTTNGGASPTNAGGNGGNSAFGGGGSGSSGDNGAAVGSSPTNGSPNTGSGGGGNAAGLIFGGCGGAAGGYIDMTITSLSSTYSYAVGSGGTGASGGSTTGANGGSGVIYITAYF